VCLVPGLVGIGWITQLLGDGMIHVRVISCFVWFKDFEGWDQICLAYNDLLALD
jgi:hypothetical protein